MANLKKTKASFSFGRRRGDMTPSAAKVVFNGNTMTVDMGEVAASDLVGMAGTFAAFAVLATSVALPTVCTHEELVANHLEAADSTPAVPLCDKKVLMALVLDAAEKALVNHSLIEMVKISSSGIGEIINKGR